MRAALVVPVAVALLAAGSLAGCDTLLTPTGEAGRRTVEGCPEAIAHLKECCPQYGSFVSCTYFESSSNANAQPDLTAGESRCLRRKPCDAIVREVTAGGSLCGLGFRDKSCK